jgi:hypothetical protein
LRTESDKRCTRALCAAAASPDELEVSDQLEAPLSSASLPSTSMAALAAHAC